MTVNVIELRDVSLWRRTQEEFHYDFKRWLFSLVRNQLRAVSRRRVLAGIDLTIPRGAKIGIIGPNGSGKSTMLKVISGILAATTGTVRVNGTISPLIELGAGFDENLSVADNIVYYGILLGYSRRTMLERMPSILEFAELSDRQHEPVKSLSSGMSARLGFAVATEMQPDILILDEVLSVGDESFKQKCRRRIRSLWNESITVIVVSHDMQYVVDNCDTVVRLEEGRIIEIGAPGQVVSSYLQDVRDAGRELIPLTAYNRFIEFAPAQLAAAKPCSAFLDKLSVDGERLDLIGWAVFDSEWGVGDDAYLLVGDRHLTRIPFGQSRPDVAHVSKEQRFENTGFAAHIDLPGLPPGEYSLRILVRRGVAFGLSDDLGPLEHRLQARLVDRLRRPVCGQTKVSVREARATQRSDVLDARHGRLQWQILQSAQSVLC